MTVPVFGINAASIRSHYFPSLAAFSVSTKPTDTTVGEMIDREAGRLVGALKAVSVVASTISADAGATYPSAYAWCQDTIAIGAAIRVMRAISGEGAVPSLWREAIEAKYKYLAEKGWVVLGDAPQPSQSVTGPRTHIGNHALDTGDESDISDVVPRFRRSDAL